MKTNSDTPPSSLHRGLGLKEATALNMIDMVGIGPFIVLPLVVKAIGGSLSPLAWVAGAFIALVDGCVWAELGAAMPEAGGTYVFLRESYGSQKWGRFMSFLFIWQTMFQAPLVIASGAIGFAQYLTYLIPLDPIVQKSVSGALVCFLVVLLYRRITTIGKVSMFLWAGVISTLIWLIGGGLSHFDSALAFHSSPAASTGSVILSLAFGQATVQTVYTFLGYYNVCHLGGEIRDPERVIPRSIFLSITGITILYLALQLSFLGVLPSQEIAGSRFVVSQFVERIHGTSAASVATLLVLWIAFASLYSALLGYSRIPYAAAMDGNFFSPFGRVHPTRQFPHISLLAMGGAAFVFSLLFKLSDVINAILATRIVVQFMGQAAGLLALHRRWPARRFPFRMLLYPLPVFAAILVWAGVLLSTGTTFVLGGLAVIATGSIVFLVRSSSLKEWPFDRHGEHAP